MKTKAVMFFVVILIHSTVTAQEPKFLFQEGNVFLSGFGGPLVSFTTLGDQFAVCNGGGGAFLINQTFFIGGYGQGLSTQHYREDLANIVDIDNPQLYFNHGGVWVGYIHRHYKPIHLGFSMKLGGGEISLVDRYFHYTPLDERQAVDMVMVITPKIEVELNLTQWMKFNTGIGYQYVGGIDKSYQTSGSDPTKYYDPKNFNKPFLSMGFLFGWFNQGKGEVSNE